MLLLVIPMTISGALGAFFFKKAAAKTESIFSLLFCPAFYIGGFLYLLGALQNIILLRYVDYSIAYPMTAITYIWTVFFSYKLLQKSSQRMYTMLP